MKSTASFSTASRAIALRAVGTIAVLTSTVQAQATAIHPGVDTMTVWMIRGNDTVVAGRLIDNLAIVSDSTGWRFLRIYSSVSILTGSRVDTLIDKVDGLVPQKSVSVIGDSVYRLEFQPGRLRGDIRLPTGMRQPIDIALPTPIINGASFDLLLRGSLLRIGDSVHAIAFTPTVLGGVARMSAKVDGQEEIAGRRTWRVIGIFPPGVRATFWIDQETRDLVQQRLEPARGVVLLFDHRAPRATPLRRRTA